MITNKQTVTYVDHMGTDLSVVQDARLSFDKTSDKLTDKDKKLIKYLADHKHMTPFEGCELKVEIECPLYIRSQIMRHRTFTYNEVSRRYTSENLALFLPKNLRAQHETSKQCSNGLHHDSEGWLERMVEECEQAMETYDFLIVSGVAREQARGILPQCLMTKFRMKGNLRNWAHFLELRLDSHAQEEAQDVARQVEKLILERFPVAYAALKEAL